MTVPGFQAFMLPTLQLLQDDQPRRSRDVVEAVAQSLQLTDEDRAETIPSGQPVHMNRAHWAMSHMFHAGLIERPSRGVVKITQAGRDALATSPEGSMSRSWVATRAIRSFVSAKEHELRVRAMRRRPPVPT